MKNVFVRDEVNASRQIEFDIAKMLCIVLMILIHCFEEIGDFSDCTSHPLYYTVVTVLDALFCASVFAGSMGLGMAYGRLQEPGDLMRRGVRLLGAGYLLTPIYFVQWFMIGNMNCLFIYLDLESIRLSTIIVIAVCVSAISIFLGDHYPKAVQKMVS